MIIIIILCTYIQTQITMSNSSPESEDSEDDISQHMESLFRRALGGDTNPSLFSTPNPHFMQQMLRMHMLQRCLQLLANDLTSALLAPNAENVTQMFLPSGNECESVTFGKLLEKWRSVQNPEGQGKFILSFVSEVNTFLSEHYQRMVRKTQSVPTPSHTTLKDENLLQLIYKVLKSPSMQLLTTNMNDLFLSIFEQAHNSCSAVNYTPPDDENTTYVTDLSAVTGENLNKLLHLFPMPPRPQTGIESLNLLMQYMPTK